MMVARNITTTFGGVAMVAWSCPQLPYTRWCLLYRPRLLPYYHTTNNHTTDMPYYLTTANHTTCLSVCVAGVHHHTIDMPYYHTTYIHLLAPTRHSSLLLIPTVLWYTSAHVQVVALNIVILVYCLFPTLPGMSQGRDGGASATVQWQVPSRGRGAGMTHISSCCTGCHNTYINNVSKLTSTLVMNSTLILLLTLLPLTPPQLPQSLPVRTSRSAEFTNHVQKSIVFTQTNASCEP